MNENRRMSASLLCALAGFLVCFFLLKWPLLISAVLALGLYFGFWFLFKPTQKIAGRDIALIAGGEEMKAMLDEGERDLQSLKTAVSQIQKTEVRRNGEELVSQGEKLLACLRENPDKIRQARRFFTYYLETSQRILNKYIGLQNTGLDTDEVREAESRAEKAIPLLTAAFQKQYSALLQGEMLDMEADIDVLDHMLRMDEVTQKK